MTSGLANGPANKMISTNPAMAMNKAGVLRLLVGFFLATATSGAAAHETIDLDKANELVAAADTAADHAKKASYG